LAALGLCWFAITHRPNSRLWGWIAGICFATASLLFFLNGFRWSWGWWW
jgi:hypothetical protein